MEVDDPRFDPIALLRVLDAHGVRSVIVGGFAGNLLGSPLLTRDLDVCYARDRDNLERVVHALRELHAYLRGAPEGLPWQLDVAMLTNSVNITVTTDFGPFDLLGEPAGVGGYDELAMNAERAEIDGIDVLVCAIEDLIRMKRAAARRKDLEAIPTLEALRERIEERRRRD